MNFNYKQYVTDEKFLKDYEYYQERYSSSIRESDKKTIDLIGEWIDDSTKGVRVLDIGCSTGNLLYHLHNVYPDLELVGCDYAETSIKKCRENTRLNNIEFHIADVTGPIKLGFFDICEKFRNHDIWFKDYKTWKLRNFLIPDWKWT